MHVKAIRDSVFDPVFSRTSSNIQIPNRVLAVAVVGGCFFNFGMFNSGSKCVENSWFKMCGE